jgi:exopolyphosphatase/guanosine-5'-triphosphate,3'-diphosphate pyrophosphatase
VIIAAIDLGTNTFSLSICNLANRKLTLFHQEKEGVQLGMGGINLGTITDDAFKRAMDCLGRFKLSCEKYGVHEIRAIGTSAIRDAKNANELIQKVKEQYQFDISIIDGIQEANYIYKGIAYAHVFSVPSLIIDIGGGSTELIFADKKGIIALNSFNMGISRIYQLFDLSDPLSIDDIQKIERYLDENTGDFFKNIKTDVLIGAAGSFDTFYEMIKKSKYPVTYESVEIPMQQFKQIIEEVINSSFEQRNVHPHIIEIRKRLAPIAAVKTRWILEKINATKIIFSPCSLKEGVLLS